jgi:hypothetical protein
MESTFDRLRHVDFMAPLLGADRVAVQGIDDGISARLLLCIARRQEHEHVAVNGISFQIAFQGGPADLNVFHGHWLGARNGCGYFGLNLGGDPRSCCNRYRQRYYAEEFRIDHRCPFLKCFLEIKHHYPATISPGEGRYPGRRACQVEAESPLTDRRNLLDISSHDQLEV